MKRFSVVSLVLMLLFLSANPAYATHITRELKTKDCTISIDAVVHQPDVLDAVPIRAVAMQWTEEKLSHFFFDDEDVDFYCQTAKNMPIIDGNLRNGNTMYDDPEKGSVLAYVDGMLEYIAPEMSYDDVYVFEELVYELPVDVPELDEEAQLAVTALKQRVEEIGLFPGEVMSIQYFDETLQAEYDLNGQCGYLIMMELCLNGIPCYPYGYTSTLGTRNCGSSIQGYVVDGQVIYLSTAHCGAYEMIEETGETAQILSLDEAIEMLEKRYANLIMEEDVNITQIRFSYMPITENNMLYHMEMRPAWCFYTESEIISLDAITGKQIR